MFIELIEKLERENKTISDPISFQDYIQSINLKAHRTADYISINRHRELREELRKYGYMVFRLGSPKGSKNTYFSLVKRQNDWSDFFFIDEDIFRFVEIESFDIDVEERKLLPFKILPKITESSLVNLAITSGLLQRALGLKSNSTPIAPATVQSTFSFEFKPLANSRTLLNHSNGQVEIDSIFAGKRNGKDCLFVMEAKVSEKFDTLAKHKLLYPILALQKSIPEDVEIIPVYKRIIKTSNAIEYNIAECRIPRNDGVFGAINELKIVKAQRISLAWS